MSLIEWKPEFSVGNAAVDHEHRELIGLINRVHAAVREQPDRDHVAAGLGEIYAQIAAHFALEEKIMRDAAYEDIGPHKADHEALLDQLADIIDGVEIGTTLDEDDLSSRLDRWFSDHFRTHDAKLHRRL
jgi:hemerythrin-like metal-binding protein